MKKIIVEGLSPEEIEQRQIKNLPVWDIKKAIREYYNFK
jgi:hypothetical protein